MNTAFREGILSMPLLEIHRTSLWHKSDIDLVDNYYLFELCSGAWKKDNSQEHNDDNSQEHDDITEYSMPTATLLWKR